MTTQKLEATFGPFTYVSLPRVRTITPGPVHILDDVSGLTVCGWHGPFVDPDPGRQGPGCAACAEGVKR